MGHGAQTRDGKNKYGLKRARERRKEEARPEHLKMDPQKDPFMVAYIFKDLFFVLFTAHFESPWGRLSANLGTSRGAQASRLARASGSSGRFAHFSRFF